MEGDEADSGERGGELGLGLAVAVGTSSDWIRCSDLTKSSTRESRASQLTGWESMVDLYVSQFASSARRGDRKKQKKKRLARHARHRRILCDILV